MFGIKNSIADETKKMRFFVFIITSFIVILISSPVYSLPDGENNELKYTLSGYVRDHSNGEMLIGVTVFCNENKTGVTTNVYGFYSLSLAPGKYSIRYSYVGFEAQEMKITLDKNRAVDINLKPVELELGEVVITG